MAHPNQHYLFVYGSLRRGETNDINELVPQAVFVSRAFVRGRLYDLGACPCIALDPLASWITGELYSVAPGALEAIDELERDSDFHRTQALVHDATGSAWPCWIYLPPTVPNHRHSMIPGGDWVRYRKVRQRRESTGSVLAMSA